MSGLAELIRLNTIEIQNLKADIFQLTRELEATQKQVEKLNTTIDDIENESTSKEFNQIEIEVSNITIKDKTDSIDYVNINLLSDKFLVNLINKKDRLIMEISYKN